MRDLERDPPTHEALQALHSPQELYPPYTVKTNEIGINKVKSILLTSIDNENEKKKRVYVRWAFAETLPKFVWN